MFIDDYEKIRDMIVMSKDDFLKSYSYLTEEEYNATYDYIMARLFPIPDKAMDVPRYCGHEADYTEDNYYYWYCHDDEPVEIIYDKIFHRMTVRELIGINSCGDPLYGPELKECVWEDL